MRALRRLAVVLVALAALGTGPARAAFESRVERRSPAHPRVILAPRPASTATLLIIFHSGSADDGLAYGLTRLSQHSLIEANSRVRREGLWRDVYAAAGTLSLETSVRQASFELTAPKGRFDALAAKLLEMILDPKLTPAGFERAKRLTLADELEAGGLGDLVSFVASRLILEGTKDGGEYNNEPYGDRDTIRGITFDDVKQYVDEKLSPANATVILTGAFDQRRLSRVLAKLKGGRARPFDRPDVSQFLPQTWERWSPLEIHMLVQVLELKSAREVAAAHLLYAILQERMLWQLRKLGVTYGPFVTPVVREWADLMLIMVPVTHTENMRVELEIRKLLDEVAEGRFLPGEFERNRSYLLDELARTDRQPRALAYALANGPGRIEWLSPEVVEQVRGFSQAEFVNTVRPWLHKDRSVNVIFGRERAVPSSRR